jgi:hypothetical protein
MKRSIVVLLITFAFVAQAGAQAVLKVQLADHSRFNVSVNGRYFNKRGTSITVGDLPPGNHRLKIFKVTFDRWGTAYDRPIYQGTIKIRQGMFTQFVYDPFTRRGSYDTQPLNNYGSIAADQPSPGSNQYRPDNNNSGVNNPPPANNNQMPDADEVATSNPDMPVASPIESGSLTDEAMAQLKGKMEKLKTDTEKLKLIKSELKRETYTVFQVGDMLDWFLFESTKLDFAKWAYSSTTDQSFYDDLSNKFSLGDSKESLAKFIKSKKQ